MLIGGSLCSQVECKKAQPKEAVQANTLLSKRLLVSTGLGAPTALAQAQAAQVQAAAIASAQAAALSNYGKFVGGGAAYPPLSAYRYAPYPLPGGTTGAPGTALAAPPPTALAAVSAVPAGAPQQTAMFTTAAPNSTGTLTSPTGAVLPSPYQSYSLANVDMSAFQGVDWSSMYGVGMYA